MEVQTVYRQFAPRQLDFAQNGEEANKLAQLSWGSV